MHQSTYLYYEETIVLNFKFSDKKLLLKRRFKVYLCGYSPLNMEYYVTLSELIFHEVLTPVVQLTSPSFKRLSAEIKVNLFHKNGTVMIVYFLESQRILQTLLSKICN